MRPSVRAEKYICVIVIRYRWRDVTLAGQYIRDASGWRKDVTDGNDNGTDGQTDGQTDRQSSTQYAAPS